jgi:hypothetical protein
MTLEATYYANLNWTTDFSFLLDVAFQYNFFPLALVPFFTTKGGLGSRVVFSSSVDTDSNLLREEEMNDRFPFHWYMAFHNLFFFSIVLEGFFLNGGVGARGVSSSSDDMNSNLPRLG